MQRRHPRLDAADLTIVAISSASQPLRAGPAVGIAELLEQTTVTTRNRLINIMHPADIVMAEWADAK